MKLYFLLAFQFLTIYSQEYDPCGYVGSSTDPEMPKFCLSTSTDCCYLAWEMAGYVFYTCVSKTKVVAAGEGKNISGVFNKYIYDVEIYDNVTRSIYSKCNNTDNVIVSPDSSVPPDPYVAYLGRGLMENSDDFDEEDPYNEFYSKNAIWRLLKRIIFYIFNY